LTLIRVRRQRRPSQILRRDLGGDDHAHIAAPCEHAAEQLLALAVAIGERGVEERAALLNRALERGQRLVVVRAGPAAHPPQAVADFGHRPAEAAEGAEAHLAILSGLRLTAHGARWAYDVSASRKP